MLFSSRLPLGNLVVLCRVLRHNLAAGLSLVDTFRQQSQRGPQAIRPVAARIGEMLKGGETLGSALEKEKALFPPLFVALVRVGEETGHLPEIFGEMEKYFVLQTRLRKQFLSQSFLPALQFVFAIFILAGLIWVLGMIAGSRGQAPPSIFGLSGSRGAISFLVGIFGMLASLVMLYLLLQRLLRYQVRVDAMLLRVPVLGPCLEAMAMSRLALAMQLTLDSGMPIMQAMRLSLEASGNAAYAARIPEVLAALKKGRVLTDALFLVRLLPPEFIDMVAIAEEGGRVPEMMRHQAEHYQEESSRRLTALTRLATTALWMAYAGCMIYAIFSIAQIYLSALGI